MWKSIVIPIIIHLNLTRALPLEQTEQTTEIPNQTTDNVDQQRTAAVVSYVQNFKNIMADYVKAQYQNLTANDMEKVKAALEGFLINFANDLKETIESQGTTDKNVTSKEYMADGLPDATFEEIKTRMKTGFPDIQDETADEIVIKLRKNLFDTRRKIDTIIYDSEKANVEYGLD